MRVILTSLVLILTSTLANAATPPLSEILNQSKCTPQRLVRKGQVQKFECLNEKSDSLQMQGLQDTAGVLSGQDEFSKFESEATDLSQAHDTETEIE